ncbi:MAG: MlaD family protein [Phycisphaerales bacterium]|nr:MlaD family protein [Phycisphaerales bacterium]
MTAGQGANNVKAGLFVLVAIVIGLIVIFVLGDLRKSLFGQPMSTYNATFPVSDGVGFLQKGSPVRIGGIAVGEVAVVEIDATQDPLQQIDVTFFVQSDIALYTNATAVVKSGLISAESFITISSVGWDAAHQTSDVSGDPGERLTEDMILAGTPSGGMLGALLGADASASVKELVSRLEEEGHVLEWIIGADAAKSFSKGTETIGNVFQHMKTDGYVIEWVLGEPAAVDIRESLGDIKELVARIQTDWMGTDEQEGWSMEISALLDKGGALAETVQIIRDFMAKNQAVFQEVMDDVQSAASDGSTVIADLRAHMPLWSENIGTMLANLDLMSQQLTLLIAEARNAPWRLLYQPSTKEVSNELLYEASRNFVFGAADLKSASASLDRLVNARGDSLNTDAADFTLVRNNLLEAVQRYERAQSQLSQVIEGATSPPPK